MIAADLEPLATPLDDLRPMPGNPRRGDVEAIAASLKAFGQRKPVVALADGTVIAGNHTLAAARLLGWESLAVVRTDDDDATAHAFALADNRTAELGGYDDAALAALIAEVHAVDAELLGATGWTGDDLQELLDRLEPEQAVPLAVDPDDVPDDAPAVTALGDVWLLGEHRLVCGDATVVADVERVMAGERADMVWTDPPYGVSYQTDLSPEEAKLLHRRTDGKEVTNDDYSPAALGVLLRSSFGNALRLCEPGAVWFVAAPPGPQLADFGVVLTELGVWRQIILWIKEVFVFGRSDYHYRHEPLLYGWVPGAAHHPPPDRTNDTVWEIPRPKRSTEHPTMKPVALIERAVLNHTDKGAIVLDPFAGSGSTLIAAHLTGRVARLVEIDPHYCDVIAKRFQLATGVVPVLEATGEPVDFGEPE